MRLLFATLIAGTFAVGSYVAFSDGPDIIRGLLHTAGPAAHKVFVPPAPPPKSAIVTVEPPETQAVSPLTPGVIPGIALPPVESK